MVVSNLLGSQRERSEFWSSPDGSSPPRRPGKGESHKSSQLDLPWFTYIFDGLWLCLLGLAFKLAGVVWGVGGERSLWVGLKEGRRQKLG